jgi:hypothetical protein
VVFQPGTLAGGNCCKIGEVPRSGNSKPPLINPACASDVEVAMLIRAIAAVVEAKARGLLDNLFLPPPEIHKFR